ncbi:MAG TPA: thiamine-phosphate kinase [Actinomycetota bacterium]
MELSEDELVAAISRVLSGEQPGVVLGLGDDAAVLEPASGQQILTTDLLIEGVHFDPASISPHDLGAKAVTVNVSDVAAMGGSPRAAVASIVLRTDVEAAWVMELYAGMRDACTDYALSLVGGDTNRGPAVVVSVTVVGEVAPGRAVTRSGARPGDQIVVTGSLGAAAGGFAVSKASAARVGEALSAPWGRELVDAFERPVARVGEGQVLARRGATAMMDLSDGLAKDLHRLCAASGVGARLELEAIPVAPALRAATEWLEADPLELAVGFGEDYELLATFGEGDVDRAREGLDPFGVTLTAVGTIIEGSGIVAVDADGRDAPLEAKGWDHFS